MSSVGSWGSKYEPFATVKFPSAVYCCVTWTLSFLIQLARVFLWARLAEMGFAVISKNLSVWLIYPKEVTVTKLFYHPYIWS